MKWSHFDYEFDLGHKIFFICVARGDPLPKVTWFKDGLELFSHPNVQVRRSEELSLECDSKTDCGCHCLSAQVREWRLPDQRVKSKLEIDPARQMDAGSYECKADNMYNIDSRTFKADFVSES